MTKEVTKEQFESWVEAHPLELTKKERADHVPPMTYWETARGQIAGLYTTDDGTSPPTVKYFVFAY